MRVQMCHFAKVLADANDGLSDYLGSSDLMGVLESLCELANKHQKYAVAVKA